MKVCPVCRRCYEDAAVSCSDENHDFLSEGRAGGCEIIPNYLADFLLESQSAVETYRAVNTILKKPYLIKILAPESFDETAKKQFLREAQALAEIIHPNVARVFDSGTLRDGSLYVVTEYFTAQTLRECLTNIGKPSEVTAVTIARQVSEGLEALHAVGVLHRNVKPENIILTADAEGRFLVKLQNIDFGAVGQKLTIASPEQNLSDLRYFSPEQCAAKETDAQTDVYALGVVLYEALAGRVPFDAPYGDAIIIKQINEPPPEIKINSFDIRMLLTHTLTDALQKQTRTRLKSANAFARQLRHIEQLATHSSTPPPAMSYPAAMEKPAISFAPPPKIEIPPPVKVVAENLLLIEKETDFREESPAVVEAKTDFREETPVIFEVETIVENEPSAEKSLLLAETQIVDEQPLSAEDQPVVEEISAPFEARTVVENSVLVETRTVDEEIPLVVENLDKKPALVENEPSIEEAPVAVETPPAIEEIPALLETETAAETAAAESEPIIEESLPPVGNQITAGSLTLAENEPVIEETPVAVNVEPRIKPVKKKSKPRSKRVSKKSGKKSTRAQSKNKILPAVEVRTVVETPFETEAQTSVENPVEVENQIVFETAVETQAVAETPAETQAVIEELTTVEDESPAYIGNLVEIQAIIGNPAVVEPQAVMEDSAPVEIPTPVEENPPLMEAPAIIEELTPIKAESPVFVENMVEIRAAAEEPPVFVDLTTNKLPPIETVIEKPLPENIRITEITPVFSLKSRASDIHKTSEPVLVDWEQPDDVPTITQALREEQIEIADAAFAPNSDFIDDEDEIIDADIISAPTVVKGYEYRRPYDEDRPLFAYHDSGWKAWNLPGKRKVLTGVGVAAFLVLIIGGTFLNRQIQSARSEDQTTAKTSPNEKTLPKTAEAEKISQTDKSPAAKPENLIINKPAADDAPDLPVDEPRERDAKTAVPTTRDKKRAVKETSEQRAPVNKTETVSREISGKKTETKPSTDKKPAAKNQPSTPAKNDGSTRPRIVKTQ